MSEKIKAILLHRHKCPRLLHEWVFYNSSLNVIFAQKEFQASAVLSAERFKDIIDDKDPIITLIGTLNEYGEIEL